jgi:long-chain acyl-CoA synthetase
MFERTGGYYTILLSGGTIAYARNISTLARDIAETRPSLLIAVPGVLEKAYNEGSRKAQSGSRIRSILISSTITNLNRRTSLRCKMKRVPWSLALRCIILDFLIARRFRKAAGGRLRLIISGGAPLDRRIARIFHILGFTIVEGYGLTETSPVVCSSLLDDNRLGTVGKPFEGVEIKISDNEEILVRGPNVMKGYLNKPEETARVIDQQGWFHTGDQGRWDDGDDLIITGRIKELIVNSFGKKIPPEPIEQRICKSQYIDQALIFGDRQRYPMALIVPNRKAIEGRAQRENIHHHNYASLLNHTRIRELIRREIKSATANLSSYEKPRAFIMTPDHFTVENGLLTSTLKLRRGAVLERYKPEINALFEQIENRHGQGNRGAKKRYGAISSLLN